MIQQSVTLLPVVYDACNERNDDEISKKRNKESLKLNINTWSFFAPSGRG